MPGTMGCSGGRNRKPAGLHVLQGTFQPSRYTGAAPEAPAGTPDARDLAGEARAEWDRMTARLEAVGTLSTIDDAALRRYAKLHAETESLEAERTRLARLSAKLTREARRLEGADLVTAIGEIVALEKLAARLSPQLRQGSMALRQWLVELGMTPAARGRIKASSPAAAAADPKKARYLHGLATK